MIVQSNVCFNILYMYSVCVNFVITQKRLTTSSSTKQNRDHKRVRQLFEVTSSLSVSHSSSLLRPTCFPSLPQIASYQPPNIPHSAHPVRWPTSSGILKGSSLPHRLPRSFSSSPLFSFRYPFPQFINNPHVGKHNPVCRWTRLFICVYSSILPSPAKVQHVNEDITQYKLCF